jgi:hypothetical protein
VQAGLLGGRDREDWWAAPRRAELLERVAGFDDPAADVWVVFDGPSTHVEAIGGSPNTRRVFTPCADEWLVARVRTSADPERLTVVTADRRLAGRARHRGARVVSPREFLNRCSG